ncbi:DUF3885 domain-containing protein [Ideonella sp. DXS29W]|uniref:DUF3885 domain-containing protein n=1 Tax=Ideonella lacteola TaxID=2984193 RepID=A0ABU9BVH1_9BURK
MRLRMDFERAFGALAFARPLFYQYPGGIRFELSEGGSTVDQFLTAMRKAQMICDSVFAGAETLTIVLCARAWGSPFSQRVALRDLRRAGIRIPSDRSMWTEALNGPVMIGDEPDVWIRIAFQAPIHRLPNLLWCALSCDLNIEPSPGITVYLADLPSQILVLPYDDRGMDVVGPNHERLASLYREFQPLTLEYDREQMQATFHAV